MFWLPIIFIIAELFYLSTLRKVLEYGSCSVLYSKYKDEKLKKYIDEKYSGFNISIMIYSIIIIFQLVYFIVGIFQPIWIYSTFFIVFLITNYIITQNSKNTSIEKAVKNANLEDFETDNIKFDRFLKMNKIKMSKSKNNTWYYYIYPTMKILAYLSIIILHYHFGIL
jgi:hypothetical protein